MNYVVVRTAVWALLIASLMLSVSLVLYEVIEKREDWMRRLALWGVVTVVVIGALLESIAFSNGVHVHETRTSIDAAVETAMYADLMKKPTSPAVAKQDIEYAVGRVITTYQVTVLYHQVAPYEFSLSASDGRGTNVSQVCVWYNHPAKVWMPTSSPCPASPLSN